MKSKYYSLKKRAHSKGLPVTISFDLFKKLRFGNCFYCGVSYTLLKFYSEFLKINTPWMTIDRKNNGGGYTPDNVVSACFLCNKIKGSFFTWEEMLEIGRLFVAPKLKKFEEEVWDSFVQWCKNDAALDEDDPNI